MSTTELLGDDQQWPTLASTTVSSSSRMKQTGTNVTAVAATTSSDWEILEDDLHALETTPITTSVPSLHDTSSGFVVVADDHQDILTEEHNQPSFSSTANRKHLRHSVSSPILSGRTGDAIITDFSDSAHLAATPTTNDHEDMDESFSLVSDVASVWTATSTTVAKSTMTVSFRDAILLSSPTTEHTTTSYRTVAASSIQSLDSTKGIQSQLHHQQQQVLTPRQRSRIQPKIVVVQSPSTPLKHMRRCSKSTGDLLRLTISEEFEMGSSSGVSSVTSSSLTCTDQLYEDEVYYRKAIGATSRINGQKLRPDEAQRREMILYKKDRQRQLSASNGKNTATGKAR